MQIRRFLRSHSRLALPCVASAVFAAASLAQSGNPLDQKTGTDGDDVIVQTAQTRFPVTFSGDGLKFIVEGMDEKTATSRGRIELGGQSFPFSGDFESDQSFRGTFQVGEQVFQFVITGVDGEEVYTLTTGNTSYRLKKEEKQASQQPRNPLDHAGGSTTSQISNPPTADMRVLDDATAAYEQSDWRRTMQLLKPLADRGHVGASFMVGVMYGWGKGVPADQVAAAKMYEQAVRGNHPGAKYNLSYLYRVGEGVKQDVTRATELVREAAESGHHMAMNDYGLAMAQGTGVKQDRLQGLAWIVAAADRGSELAMNNIDIMEQNGTIRESDWDEIDRRLEAIDKMLPADDGIDFLRDFNTFVQVESSAAAAPGITSTPMGPATTGSAQPTAPSTGAAPFDQGARSQATSAAPQGALVLQQITLKDPGMDNMESHTLLKPKDWQLSGGVQWDPMQYQFPVNLNLRVTSPEGAELAVYPGGAFEYVDYPGDNIAGMPLPQIGSYSNGRMYMPPPDSVAAFVTNMLLPAQRPQATNVRAIESQELPEVVQYWMELLGPSMQMTQQNNAMWQQMGSNSRSDDFIVAERVRVTYQENGRAYDEDVYVSAFLQRAFVDGGGYMPNMTSWTWLVTLARGARAPQGQLERHTPLIESISLSVQTKPRWQAIILELQRRIAKKEMDAIKERGRIWREAQDDIWRTHQSSVAEWEKSQDRMSNIFSNYIRDVDDWQLEDGSTVKLPDAYDRAYTNNLGEYILTNDQMFNPAEYVTGDWNEIQRVRR